jgi:hypothetical protein
VVGGVVAARSRAGRSDEANKKPLRWQAPEGQILEKNQNPRGAPVTADTIETTATETWTGFVTEIVRAGCMIAGAKKCAHAPSVKPALPMSRSTVPAELYLRLTNLCLPLTPG